MPLTGGHRSVRAARLAARATATIDGVTVDLDAHWFLGGVEIPGRVVLAPMAGVSVQAFRRQGRRYGAGLVCSEMVSVAGIQHGNERTLGYLRVAARRASARDPDLRLRPGAMAEAARRVEAAGADIVDINFGCPVRKVTKTGAGASLLDDPAHAAARSSRRSRCGGRPAGLGEDAPRHRERLARLPRASGRALVEAGAASLTLHPRSARQMYTGFADHSLTAELVVARRGARRSPRATSPRAARAQAVLATTGAAGGDGRPRGAGEPLGDPRDHAATRRSPRREEVVAELLLFIRETVRELGERRATGFLKKFYAWYLGRGRFPKPFKQELVAARDDRGGRAARCSRPRRARPRCSSELEALRAAAARRGRARLAADLDLRRRLMRRRPRRRLSVVSRPDEPEPLQRQLGVDRGDRPRVGCDQLGEAAGRDDRRSAAPSSSRMRSTIASTWPAKP